MTTTPGVDYSSGRPGGAALAAAGIKFAARYLSHTASKNLTLAEAEDLAAHGVACVVVWETTQKRASAGRAAGIADAHDAAAQAAACGQPPHKPIYFAVDYDADPATCEAYFEGVASVIGLSRTAGYGGFKVIKHLLDRKLITWAWQTVAWSGGRWDARAHIRQYASTVHIAGVTCDKDTAQQTDYGQWMPGQEDDVAITDADRKAIVKDLITAITAPEVRDMIAMAVIYHLIPGFDPSIALPAKGASPAQQQSARLRAAIAKHDAAAAAAVPEIDYGAFAGALLAGLQKAEG